MLSLGKGAWFTCWAIFFIRSVGLSAAEFGIGITVAGVIGVIAGAPFGYLADRLGARETLIGLVIVQGLAIFSYAFVHGFWSAMVVTCVVVGAERSASGIRIAVISGLTSDADRLHSISTARVLTQGGIVVGTVIGAVVLSLDSRPGYLALVFGYAAASLVFAVLLAWRVPHVASLGDRKVKRKALALRDRPFLLITLCNGLLALNWGMLESGMPLWITTHTHAPAWIIGVIMGANAVAMVLFQNPVTKAGTTVADAGWLGLWSGIVLAAACAFFTFSYRGAGTAVIVALLVAAAVHVIGELLFVGSGLGLSVGLTPPDAHGEYQGMFATGQAIAMIIAPGIMTALLVGWGVLGWFVLATLYVLGGIGTILVAYQALAVRRSAARPGSSPVAVPGSPPEAEHGSPVATVPDPGSLRIALATRSRVAPVSAEEKAQAEQRARTAERIRVEMLYASHPVSLIRPYVVD